MKRIIVIVAIAFLINLLTATKALAQPRGYCDGGGSYGAVDKGKVGGNFLWGVGF